ncbi:MAG TPA: cation:proton antiporter [Rhodocyclaceae bacterium]|nr:cation:proton antiporter [Rhodocyclaceae bacterium]
MSFLPTLPAEIDAFARVALLLISAIAFAQLGERYLRLPRLTGYVLAGLVMGPSMLNLTPLSVTGDLRPLMLLGLGLLLFELGSRVNLRWLQANPMLLASSLIESGATFAATYAFLAVFDFPRATCISVAAIAVSTSPTVIMRIVAENNARGQMTQRLLLLSALNCLYAILLLNAGVAFVHFSQNANPLEAIGHPLYVVCGSFLLAAAIAYGIHRIRFSRIQRESERFTLVIAIVLLATTVADHFGLSVPMALLCGGILLRTVSQRLHLFPEHFGSAGALLVVILFALTGVALDPQQLAIGGAMSIGLLLIRAAAKYCGGWLSAVRGGLAPNKAAWLGLALLPMSSQAVLHAYEVANLYPNFGDDIFSIILGAVLVMELIGPIIVQLALRRAGETSAPRAEANDDA